MYKKADLEKDHHVKIKLIILNPEDGEILIKGKDFLHNPRIPIAIIYKKNNYYIFRFIGEKKDLLIKFNPIDLQFTDYLIFKSYEYFKNKMGNRELDILLYSSPDILNWQSYDNILKEQLENKLGIKL